MAYKLFEGQRALAQTVSTHRTMAESSYSNNIHAQDNGRELLLKQYPRTGQWLRDLAQTVSTHRTVAERSYSNSIHTQDNGREILLKQYPHTGQWQRDLTRTISTHRTVAERSCSNSIHTQDNGLGFAYFGNMLIIFHEWFSCQLIKSQTNLKEKKEEKKEGVTAPKTRHR